MSRKSRPRRIASTTPRSISITSSRHPLDERLGRELVQHPRQPSRSLVEELYRPFVEEESRRPRHRQPVAKVGEGAKGGERRQVELGPDPLGEGPVGAVPQTLAQLGLAHQHHRDQVAVVELEVREQADFLEGGLARDEMGLVHDQEGGPSRLVELEEPVVDLRLQVGGVKARVLDPELGRQRAQELARRQARVQDHRDLVLVAQPVHEGPGEQGLARAHLAGEEGEIHLLDREEKLLERFLVDLVQEEVAGIGGLAEGPLLEPVVRFVHG